MNKHLLRTALLFLIFNFSFFIAKAQWVSIPDTIFGTWLKNYGYTVCMQGNSQVGWQMDTSCPAVVNAANISCSFMGIRDLTGIQYFDSLKTLDCSLDSLTFLPN